LLKVKLYCRICFLLMKWSARNVTSPVNNISNPQLSILI
jgi:hypothetical protein